MLFLGIRFYILMQGFSFPVIVFYILMQRFYIIAIAFYVLTACILRTMKSFYSQFSNNLSTNRFTCPQFSVFLFTCQQHSKKTLAFYPQHSEKYPWYLFIYSQYFKKVSTNFSYLFTKFSFISTNKKRNAVSSTPLYLHDFKRFSNSAFFSSKPGLPSKANMFTL